MNLLVRKTAGANRPVTAFGVIASQSVASQQLKYRFQLLILLLALALPSQILASGTLTWSSKTNQVSADIKSENLLNILSHIASVTGWHIYVEPDTIKPISAKFSDLSQGEALRLLLGGANFALLPAANTNSRLFVFHTSRDAATQFVPPGKEEKKGTPKIIPNELIVRIKPGADINEIAKLLGAKVVGRIDDLNAYRLRFDDEAATTAARSQLASNSQVASVEDNYYVERPNLSGQPRSGNTPPDLQVNPPPDTGKVSIGLIDTPLQSLGKNMDSLLQDKLSVVGDGTTDSTSPTHATSMYENIRNTLADVTKGSTSISVISVDVYGNQESTSTFDVAKGVAAAVNKGANIINLSLGSDADSSVLHDVITQSSSKGVFFIASAGNTPVTTPTYPAAYSEVMGVTAVDNGQLASYANRGAFIALGAPGTATVYFNGQVYSVAGTSSSAAYISAIAAAYQEANHATPTDLRQFLKSRFGVSIRTQ
jgi:hypothetical protein